MAELTKEQMQDQLLQAGWTQWTDEVADDSGKVRQVKVPFWKDSVGIVSSFRNEMNQWEYASGERRYTMKEAIRIQNLREQTAIYRAELRAEQEKKQGRPLSAGRPMTAAEAAAQAAMAEAGTATA